MPLLFSQARNLLKLLSLLLKISIDFFFFFLFARFSERSISLFLSCLNIFFPSFANESVSLCVCLQVCVLKRAAEISDVCYKLKMDSALLDIKNVASS